MKSSQKAFIAQNINDIRWFKSKYRQIFICRFLPCLFFFGPPSANFTSNASLLPKIGKFTELYCSSWCRFGIERLFNVIHIFLFVVDLNDNVISYTQKFENKYSFFQPNSNADVMLCTFYSDIFVDSSTKNYPIIQNYQKIKENSALFPPLTNSWWKRYFK